MLLNEFALRKKTFLTKRIPQKAWISWALLKKCPSFHQFYTPDVLHWKEVELEGKELEKELILCCHFRRSGHLLPAKCGIICHCWITIRMENGTGSTVAVARYWCEYEICHAEKSPGRSSITLHELTSTYWSGFVPANNRGEFKTQESFRDPHQNML